MNRERESAGTSLASDGPEPDRDEQGKLQKELLQLVVTNGRRARDLNTKDVTTRLLLFRIELMRGEHVRAAEELRNASSDIESFDVSELSDAACTAHDTDSAQAVVLVLNYGIHLDKELLQRSIGQPNCFPSGFYGKLLLSYFGILTKEYDSGSDDDDENSAGES